MPTYNKKKGMAYIAISCFSFALMSVAVRKAGNLPSFEKALFRNIVNLIIAYAALKRQHLKLHIPKEGRTFTFFRAVVGTAGLFGNFYAIDHLNLADASLLTKMSSFYSLLASYFILKEKVSLRQAMVITIAFLGSLLVIKPSPGNMAFFPALIGALGGMCSGIAYSCVRGASSKGVPKPLIVFAFCLTSVIIFIPLTAANFVMPTPQQFIWLLLCGVFATIAQFSLTTGYSFAPARDVSVVDYSQIVFAAALGFIFFGQIPDLLSVLGYIVIISVGVYSFMYDRKQNS